MKKVTDNNNKLMESLIDNSIFVSNVETNVEQKYYFENQKLYDENGKAVVLTGIDKPVHFIECSIDKELFENIELKSSCVKEVDFDYSSITNECLSYLPETLEQISLDACFYITDLNELAINCPNVRYIDVNNCVSLKDLSFIYKFPKLEEVNISNNAYVTEEVLKYLKDNNIKTNLNEQDIINSKYVDDIINRIISPEMSDIEKIQAVSLYVIEHLEYDLPQVIESNYNPLECAIDDGKVVCLSYAYLTNILLDKAGITSYVLTDDSHAWNMLELDNMYYYVDTTNMDDSKFHKFLLENLNVSKYYMIDTEATFLSVMSSLDSGKIDVPSELFSKVQLARNNKSFLEKSGGIIGGISEYGGALLSSIIVVYGYTLLGLMPGKIKRLFSDVKDDYLDIKNESVKCKLKK